MEKLLTFINYVLDGINNISTAGWWSIGFVLGSIPVVIGIVAWINRRNLRKYGEKLESVFTIANVAFWGFLLATADIAIMVITQGQAFGSLFPSLFVYWPQISGGAVLVHTVSKHFYAKWQARKQKQPFVNKLPDLQPLVDAVTTPVNPGPQNFQARVQQKRTAPSSDMLL